MSKVELVPVRRKIIRVSNPPEGFVYRPEFVKLEEHDDLIQQIAGLPFRHFEMQGYVAKRLVYSFGYRYSYEDHHLTKAEPLPDWILPLRKQCAEFAQVPESSFEQVLIAKYPKDAAIGWHRDKRQFGPTVVGLSLAAPATMRFRLISGDYQEIYKLSLAPCSAYVITGPARAVWEHSLNPTEALRYSITFRTLRSGQKIG